MGAVTGCFVLSVIYLSCDINPLSFASYPIVQFVTFPSSGTVPRIISYRYEDWGNLKFVNSGRNVYSCGKGQCFINPDDIEQIDVKSTQPIRKNVAFGITPTTASDMFKPKPSKFQPFRKSIQSTHRNEPFDISPTVTSAKFKPTQTMMKINPVNPLQTTMNLDQFVSQPMTTKDDQINSGNISKPCLMTRVSKYFKDRFQKLGKSLGSELYNEVKENLTEVFKKQFEKIEELIIGLSSTTISIPVIGGVIVFGVKIYQKRHRNLNIPEHFYLPLHRPGTVGDLPQFSLDSETDEDIEVFDIRKDKTKCKRPLTPSAPKKDPTPKIDERETAVKQRLIAEDFLMTSTPLKVKVKSTHRRSRSDETSNSSPFNPYNLRPRDPKAKIITKKGKKVLTTEL